MSIARRSDEANPVAEQIDDRRFNESLERTGNRMASKSKIAEGTADAEVLHRAAMRRCKLCGRPRAVYRKFGICRICFRKLADQGLIPGVKKASW